MKEDLMKIQACDEKGMPRKCPECKSVLSIDVKTHIVSCLRCGYIEPCHLEGKIPSEKNCSKCVYSPYSAKINFAFLKNLALKEIRKNKHKPRLLTPSEFLRLEKQLLIKYPRLKGKCTQAFVQYHIGRLENVRI